MIDKDDHKTPSDSLSASDMKRHADMVVRYHEAQQLAQQAQQLQTRANELVAAFKIWAEELHERYGLDGAKGEGVSEDGKIIRANADTKGLMQ